jgi:hypothetical protein
MDRSALKEILKPVEGLSDWCVACGAGAASAKLDMPTEAVAELSKQLADPRALREFVNSIKEAGFEEKAWCVACGAGKDASPQDLVVNPANLPDSFIDELAAVVISGMGRVE